MTKLPPDTTSITPGFFLESDYEPGIELDADLPHDDDNSAEAADRTVTVPTTGGVPMTDVVTADAPADVEDETMGGKPNSGTPKDKRLKTNKQTKPAKADGDTEDLADAADLPPVMQETPQWRGVLVIEGSPTGDGRQFAADSLTWADPPLPLRWQKVDSHGGMPTNETVRVGTIQRVWRDGADIMGEGVFDLSGPDTDDAHTAYRANQSGALTGVSIDADDITDADVEYVFNDPEGEEEDDDLFMLLFAQPDMVVFHAARIRAATLCDIPAFVEAKISAISEEDQAALTASGYVPEVQPPPPYGGEGRPALVAHAWHDEWRPPKAWFDDPKLGQYVPIMVTDQGRVYGHVAPWGQCHLGYSDECIMPPFEASHDYFLTGDVPVDDGSRIAVGQITAGIDHAAISLGWTAAKQHYEVTDAVVADVTIGNDAHGIWVAGAVRPWADPARVHALRASGQVSPDWRYIGSSLRMVGLLTVNVSGYQVPRPKSMTHVASGQLRSLIVENLAPLQLGLVASAHREQAARLEREQRLALRAELIKKVHGEEV